jgi:hypothetical protein
MQQKDAKDFLRAARTRNNSSARGPKREKDFLGMKRKRRVKSQEVDKYKARLNLDGSQGKDYDMTYAPVTHVRIFLSLVLRHN